MYPERQFRQKPVEKSDQKQKEKKNLREQGEVISATSEWRRLKHVSRRKMRGRHTQRQ